MKRMYCKAMSKAWMLLAAATPTPAPNGGIDIVTSINTAKTIIFDSIAAVGGIFFVWGLIKAVRSNSKGMDDGVDKGIGMAITGIVMAGAGTLLAVFGLS